MEMILPSGSFRSRRLFLSVAVAQKHFFSIVGIAEK